MLHILHEKKKIGNVLDTYDNSSSWVALSCIDLFKLFTFLILLGRRDFMPNAILEITVRCELHIKIET